MLWISRAFRIHQNRSPQILTDLKESVKDADLIIEAIPEIMELKKETFKIVDESASAHDIIASNTSSMSIAGFAKHTRRADIDSAVDSIASWVFQYIMIVFIVEHAFYRTVVHYSE